MSHTPSDANIEMLRPDLEALPPLRLPDGFTLHTLNPEAPGEWCRLIAEAFDEAPSTEKFRKEILEYRGYGPEHVYFLYNPKGEACATASAMLKEDPACGYLHWVAVDPGYLGMRLGYWVSLQTLHDFRERGCTRASLITQSHRIPAIKTYLRLGFVPHLRHEDEVNWWAQVRENLDRPLPPFIDARDEA